jgi:serine/alanine adding enzyme
LVQDAIGQAIYVEVRISFDTADLRGAFERQGFTFVPHLNFLLEVKGEEDALNTLSSTRRREIRGSLAAGAAYGEAANEQEVADLYGILATLYREKVRKPLPSRELFLRLHTSPYGRVFVVRHGGRVIGGSAGPVYKDRVIYYWYACGDNTIRGVHASVLATWAPIEHAARHGIKQLDFMGAGKPGQGYGVHDFKARFGGAEVSYGRYERVLNRPLYRLGVSGLKAYQGAKALMGTKR